MGFRLYQFLIDRTDILYNMKMNFVTIDFETAKHSRESACAIGMVKFLDGEPQDTYYSLIRPPKLFILPEFTEIHGLTVDDVRDAPTFDKIWNKVKAFIGDNTLAAHNAQFDMGVLNAVLDWYGLDNPNFKYFCTCQLARKTWHNLDSYSLSNLASFFGIVYNAHNALDDALTCGKIALLAAQKNGSANI